MRRILVELGPIWRKYIVIIHDVLMSALAVGASFWIRFREIPRGAHLFADDLLLTLAIMVPLAAGVFRICGLYRGVWRFASTPDLANIVRAATVLTVALVAVDFLARGQIVVPRTVVFVYWFLQIGMLSAPRLAYRVYADSRRGRGRGHAADAIPALVVGTGAETEMLIRLLQSTPYPTLRVVGLLAQSRADLRQTIRGVDVVGLSEDLAGVVGSLSRKGIVPRRLLFTREALERQDNPVALIEQARRLDLVVGRIAKGALSARLELAPQLAPIRMEDLLERPTVKLNEGEIRALVGGRRVVVTGGGGSIGSEICQQVAELGAHRVVIAENSEFALYQVLRALEAVRPGLEVIGRICDVRDRAQIEALFAEFRPELVFHAAALKQLPIVEDNRAAGAMTNIIGTRNVADAAKAHGALAMVLISTDKAIKPSSFLGATKRVAELYCQALDSGASAGSKVAGAKITGARGAPTRFLSVRFGNVLASNGSVLWVFREQIEQGGPVTVTHPEMERYFMSVSEATSLVLSATAHGLADPAHDGSVFMLDMGKPVKIIDLAHRMIRLAGFEPDQDIAIEIVGIRPGERLREELFHAGEPVSRIDIEGVFAAKPRSVPFEALVTALKRIEAAAKQGDETALLRLIGKLVPDYSGHMPEADTNTAAAPDADKIVYLAKPGKSAAKPGQSAAS
ncbi:MAG: nucleoside-diphosphate sugar epimerase/dehydratase [Hyphomicrobiales bacterium]|nr:nucleoside-diphosphate sugar epimerase/dehydratase [Hyphomicrobiales bacterium]